MDTAIRWGIFANPAQIFSLLVHRHVAPVVAPKLDHKSLILSDCVVPSNSTSEYVRMLRFDGSPEVFVVRAKFRKFNPIRPWGRFRRLSQSASFCRLLHDRGIAVPQIRMIRSGVEWPMWLQYWIGVEEYIQGHEIDRSSREQVVKTFELLGRLHSVRSEKWGRPGIFSGGSAMSFSSEGLSDRVLHKLRKARVPARARRRLLDWAIQEMEGLLPQLGPCPFSFTHGDFKCSNNLYTPDGKVVAIDFEHSRYWLAGVEFLKALSHFCSRNTFANDAARAYFSTCDPHVADQLRKGEKLMMFLASLDWHSSQRVSALPWSDPFGMPTARGLLADGPDSPWDVVVRRIHGAEATPPP